MEPEDEVLEKLVLLLLAESDGQTPEELVAALERVMPALPAKPERN